MNYVTLITGASSGIGYELSKIFVKKSTSLILVSRNLDNLKEVKLKLSSINPNCSIYLISADLSKDSAPLEVFNKVVSLDLKVTHLINNAGFGLMGKFKELPLNKQLDMINLNIKSLVSLTYLFLDNMKSLNFGKIINVASLAAFTPGPNMAIYYASKSFVLSFSTALKEELRFSKISVITLCPGPTKSNFSKASSSNNSLLFLTPMSTKRVARTLYYSMKLHIPLVIPGILNKVFALWLKLTPSIINSQFVKLTSLKVKKRATK